jgi:hypothetical protein
MRLTSVRQVNERPYPKRWGLHICGREIDMHIRPGHVYYVDDSFFEDAMDPTLMQNKGNRKRPLYYCSRDEQTGLLWLVPMSTQTEKYKAIYDKNIARYGRCLTIVFDMFDGKLNAFLLQNMAPVLEKYITSVHSRRGIPVTVHSKTQEIIETNIKELLKLRHANLRVVFTDIEGVKERMLSIRERDEAQRNVAATTEPTRRNARNKHIPER